MRVLTVTAVLAASGLALPAQDPRALARAYTDAIRKVNEDHARKPGKAREADLRKRVPRAAASALDALLKIKASPALFDALVSAGEAALDLDLADDFARVDARLKEAAPDHQRRLGAALSRERFVLRGLNGLDAEYLERFAIVLEAVLGAYDEVFGFAEWSKVPGKKLRVRVHLEPSVVKPHFAPQFPFHSEIDFPVVDAAAFRSPAGSSFLFYGLCHELGHVIAMWGNGKVEADHHAWAHYTGVVIVEHLTEKARDEAWMRELRDGRWRSLTRERQALAGKEPSLESNDGVLALLIALHDTVGPRALGSAINHADAVDKRLRIGKVRYYSFDDLQSGLMASHKDKKSLQAAVDLLKSARSAPSGKK